MPTKRFLIHYPDGTKEQVPTAEKEQLLLSGVLRPIDANRFEYIGQRKTLVFHSFRELEGIATALGVTPAQLKRFLAGYFVWEIDEKRLHELMETPEALGLGLRFPRGPACKFNSDYAMQEIERRQKAAA
jgi:hypothetical protein